MANSYYSRQGSYTKGTLARGDVVKSDFDALVTAWDTGETNIERAIKLPDESTDFEFTENAATRANKAIGFDSTGALELQTGVGSWEGTWATTTAYELRDVVVDGAAGASTDNLYICIVAHTSGTWATDLSASKWELMVNVSEARDWARKTDGIVDSLDYSARAYAIGGTGVTTTASKGAAKEWATTTGGYVDTAEYSAKEYAIGTTVAAGSSKDWAMQASGKVDGVSYSAKYNADASSTSAASSASSASAASSSQSAAATSATNAATSETNAAASYDAFDDRYLGSKSSDPTVDNDGNTLLDGAIYWNSTDLVMKAYDLSGTAWNRITPTTTEQGHINTVSGISTNVTTVAGISANVTTVAGISSNVTTVAGDSTEIGIVAGDTTEIGTVAGDTAEIGTVAGISANVSTVAGISANVTTVAGISANVTTVAGISSDVTGVNSISSDVTSVAGDATDIGVVAGAISPTDNVGTVATNVANVNTTAGSIANVNTTAGSIANVNTVAGSIADVNRYANEYTISASAPGTPSAGDLWYDSASTVLKYFNGTSWAALTGDTDVLVGNSAIDTTAGYLSAKVAAGNNVTLTTLNSGGNEQLQITATDNSAAMALALGG